MRTWCRLSFSQETHKTMVETQLVMSHFGKQTNSCIFCKQNSSVWSFTEKTNFGMLMCLCEYPVWLAWISKNCILKSAKNDDCYCLLLLVIVKLSSLVPPPILHTFFLLFNTCGPFYHPGHLPAPRLSPATRDTHLHLYMLHKFVPLVHTFFETDTSQFTMYENQQKRPKISAICLQTSSICLQKQLFIFSFSKLGL